MALILRYLGGTYLIIGILGMMVVLIGLDQLFKYWACHLSAADWNDTVGKREISFDLCRKFWSSRRDLTGKTIFFDFSNFGCFNRFTDSVIAKKNSRSISSLDGRSGCRWGNWQSYRPNF